ncbi:cationic peroxidase SPC4-like [Lolium rigidum]|uniref:cationic peroxidase SPC4-like n=1 Tax=Lolium rigidum TaxID=89674 RepID=UPI001F5D489E|nr:cationic peroxidase SPC4-like [Lolium rigidum]
MASSRVLLLVVAAMAISVSTTAAATKISAPLPPLAKGLNFDFYKATCPQAESIVFNFLSDAIRKDVGLAAALLRIHFHDCFVQGCDGSVLLDKTGGTDSEKIAPPNVTLRPTAFKAINDLRALLAKACGAVVSCADIAALAARDSVHLAGGPHYPVPLGRRDGLAPANLTTILNALPAPSSNVTTLLRFLAKISLDANDLVALSGAHTLGIAHCTSFQERLFPQNDVTLNKWFASQLRLTCPALNTDNTTNNDIRTPNVFDNKYYVDLLNRQGLFTSDQDLHTDARTKPTVTRFAVDQAAFFDQFVFSVVKMGQINVLTGNQGQIRNDCSAPNKGRTNDDLPWSVLETVTEAAQSLVL